MGEPRGFMKYERKIFGKEPVTQRLKHYNEFLTILPQAELAQQGARCMDWRTLLPHRLPAGQYHSRLQRLGLSRSVAGGERAIARHQQLSGIHRPRLPRAL